MNKQLLRIGAIAVLLCSVITLANAAETRAIIVGISVYDPGCERTHMQIEDGICNHLDGAGEDALAISAELKQLGVPPDHIVQLIDGAATRTAFLAALEDAAKWAAPGRQLLVYFSGHGTGPQDPENRELHLPDGTGALVFATLARSSGELAADQLVIGQRDLRPLLERIDRAGTTVFGVFDACFSQESVRSAGRGLGEKRWRSRSAGTLEGYVETSGLRHKTGAARVANQSAPAPAWPYQHVVYFSAASADETAVDIDKKVLAQFPTVDGKPHGALTDALLQVLSGKEPVVDRTGTGVLSYAALFDATAALMRRRAYGQMPHRQPRLFASKSVSILDAPVLGLPIPVSFKPGPDATQVRIGIDQDSSTDTVRTTLAATPGITLVDGAPEYVVHYHRRLPADDRSIECCVVTTGTEDAMLQSDSGSALPQSVSEVIESMQLRARLRQLKALADSRAGGFAVEAGFDNPEVGETVVAGQAFGLEIRSAKAATVAVLHVNGDGTSDVLLPATNDSPYCKDGSVVHAGESVVLCRFGGAASPFGLDLVYILAFEGDARGLATLPLGAGRAMTSMTLDALERLIKGHPGRVSIQEMRLFTLKTLVN